MQSKLEESVEDAALRVVQPHAAELLRFARRFSHCADDAHDAYQRTLEILVRRVREDPPAHPLNWFRTVLRHEALSIRAERERWVGHADVDFDRHEDREADDPAERAVGQERLQRTAEALQRLKPQELKALVLRAEGLSYREICARTGWTYTRANRTITEGRRALLERLDAIESGAECERWLPLLSALADGEATRAEVAELRPHLRACPACRATLRDCHALPARVAALAPPALLAAAAPRQVPLLHHLGAGLQTLAERATLLAARVQGAFEAAPAAKLAAVAASTAAIAGGGVALEQASHAPAAPRREAATTAPSGGVRLAARAFPAYAAGVSGRSAPRARAPRGEFAPPPAGPSEFAPHGVPRAEFASAPKAAAGPSPPAAAAAARPSSEFGGP